MLVKLMFVLLLSGNGLPATATASAADQTIRGTVEEVIDVDSYVYLRVASDQGDIWIATTPIPVSEGESVSFPRGVPMQDFHSKSLDRTFKSILFVDNVTVDAENARADTNAPTAPHAGLPENHPVVTPGSVLKVVAAEGVAPLKDGLTLAQIYAGYPDNSGQAVRLRARVVKFSPKILGTNWATLADGTGTAPDNVLVAKTAETFVIGDEVVMEGTLKADVSLGYGYDYKLLLEEAKASR